MPKSHSKLATLVSAPYVRAVAHQHKALTVLQCGVIALMSGRKVW